jgi:hypothetical protein
MSLFNNAIIGASSQGGYQISRSVRIRQSASAYFNRTFATPISNQKMTLSCWVKVGSTSQTAGQITLLNGGNGTQVNASNSFIQLRADGTGLKLQILCNSGGAATVGGYRTFAPYFRDNSAWYHIVLAADTTQATAANRYRGYINGVEITSYTGVDPNQNVNITWLNTAVDHLIGRNNEGGGPVYGDTYITEMYWIDGQQLTPSSFGETNAVTGVWQPKKYAGTYGTNGYYLNFSDNSNNTAATIGKDNSGNGNNWTPNNISVTAGATYDSMLDVPTLYADGGNGRGNYATFNPLSRTACTITNGNLQAVGDGGNYDNLPATIAFDAGGSDGFYWEFTSISNDSSTLVGICSINNSELNKANPTFSFANSADGWGYIGSGNKTNSGTNTSYGNSWTNNDVIGIAVKNGKIWFSKNGTFQASGDPAAGTNQAFSGISGLVYPVAGINGTANFIANFGQRPFIYTPPTGFKALNTQNLPDAPVKKGNQHFDVVTSTATVSTGITVSSLAFSPGLMWRKNRNNVESHYWVDAVRGTGAGGFLVGNSTAAATGYPNSDGTLTFNSNGYTITETNWGAGEFYFNSRTYVDWMWNAGSLTVTNTDGTISAQVRANPTSGFSIVTYTGTGAAATIGHGLGVAPRMIIVFERSPAGDDHIVYHANLTSNQYSIRLNTTAAQAGPSGAYWNSASPTSTVFSVGTSGESNQSTATYVAYCFAPVAGYSAFGGYTGNGSADGPFVFTGFRPRFVMIRAFSTGLRDWLIYDTSTSNPNNPGSDGPLIAASTDVTSYDGVGYTSFDILSNGFKVRAATTNLNASGESHLFMAFAENPFKHSLAR